MMCLDCPMHKYVSNCFGQVQVAPTVLAVELEMVSPDGCGVILELITPAQSRIDHQHCTRMAMLLVLVALSTVLHCEYAGSATSSILRQQT